MSGAAISVPLEACRGCLRPGKSYNLFGKDDLFEKFKFCTQLKVEKNDGMTGFLCQLCFSHLEVSYNFKRMCRETHGVLKGLLQKQRNGEIQGREASEMPEIEGKRESDEEEENQKTDENDFEEDVIQEDPEIDEEVEEIDEEIEEIEEEAKQTEENKEELPEIPSEAPEQPQKYPENRLECSLCSKKYSCPQALKLHTENTHRGVKRFSCSICSMRFTQKHSLQSHTMCHTNERPFCCAICKKGFRRKTTLQMHMNCHTGETPYTCSQCGVGFRTTTALRNHGHNLRCPICSKSFQMIPSLQAHIQRHKQTDGGAGPGLKLKVKHICSECGKSYACRAVLEAHRVIHTGEKPFKCTQCDKAFPLLASLKVHMRNKHPNSRLFVCDICGMNFGDSGKLMRHKTTHIIKDKDVG
uniref:Putative c2h2-type zn-finger protein n=1 Tax=Lutzomyia longipalpis TaxID=7200 RepID=A0A1B0CTR0_LUTLO